MLLGRLRIRAVLPWLLLDRIYPDLSAPHFMRNAPPDQWGERMDSHLALPELLAEAQRIAGEAVRVIAVDMPVALTPVRSRRRCDKAISTLFGANWCSTHSAT
jgi:hypothetical protein